MHAVRHYRLQDEYATSADFRLPSSFSLLSLGLSTPRDYRDHLSALLTVLSDTNVNAKTVAPRLANGFPGEKHNTFFDEIQGPGTPFGRASSVSLSHGLKRPRPSLGLDFSNPVKSEPRLGFETIDGKTLSDFRPGRNLMNETNNLAFPLSKRRRVDFTLVDKEICDLTQQQQQINALTKMTDSMNDEVKESQLIQLPISFFDPGLAAETQTNLNSGLSSCQMPFLEESHLRCVPIRTPSRFLYGNDCQQLIL
ncbi:unnamed protein product [Protopolystoma xenopodis]|uniref:Uncharacterized protein n=1 Tax=Protopolystoma xenopodis TaxID=117903 RepID=A0A448WRD7_9PLAT|nr:unnamed protein product [Protopolystoma xenopodis]